MLYKQSCDEDYQQYFVASFDVNQLVFPAVRHDIYATPTKKTLIMKKMFKQSEI